MLNVTKSQYGVYRFRQRIDTNLRKYFNRSEISISLKTKSLPEAQAKASIYHKEFSAIRFHASIHFIDSSVIQKLVDKFCEDVLGVAPKPVEVPKEEMNFKQSIEDFCYYYKAKNIGKGTRDAVTHFLNSIFLDIIGAETKVKDTTVKDLVRVKEQLFKLPRRNIPKYQGKSTKQLLKMNIPEEDRLSINRVQGCVNYIKRYFNYCFAQQLIPFNPANFISVTREETAIDEREPFSREEVRELLHLTDTLNNQHARTIYYTLAYTGMRLSELWKCSINQIDGVYCFDLTSKRIKLKTKSSHRLIPIHEKLIELGVIESFAQAVQVYKSNSIGCHYKRNLRGRVTDNPKKVMYSLRHSFATELKYSKADPLVISELMGHSHEGMTMGRYASRYPVEILKEAIDHLDYS